MPAENDNKREAPISYRPPKELRAELERRVDASGLSTSAFITKSIFGVEPPRQSRRPSIEHQAVAQILGELARVRDQLHTVAIAIASGPGSGVILEEAVRSLTEIRSACFKALGRKP